MLQKWLGWWNYNVRIGNIEKYYTLNRKWIIS